MAATLASTTAHFGLIVALFLLLCFASAPLKTVTNRKVLAGVEIPGLAPQTVEAAAGENRMEMNGGSDMGEKAVESELRTVPAGPDPLRHHSSTPRKPDNRTTLPRLHG